jgi:hypothetical protein
MQLEIIAKKLILKSFKIRFFFVLIEIFLDIDSIEIISWGNIVQIQSKFLKRNNKSFQSDFYEILFKIWCFYNFVLMEVPQLDEEQLDVIII